MHPRQDVTHHSWCPTCCARCQAVWTQGSRSPNNDLSLVHEQALLDFAAGHVFLRERGFADVVTLGHSGGAALVGLLLQQAGRAPGDRLAATPSGRPVPPGRGRHAGPRRVVFLAPHPGQGALLLRLIDPSVTDEDDPLSVDPALDPFSPANGFRDAPESSTYSPDFVERYRPAQPARVRRIDAEAAAMAAHAAGQPPVQDGGTAADRRRALAPRLITVYRTDADLRNVDLSLDANDRPYGSLFGRRPDLTNYGLAGFGRFSTPRPGCPPGARRRPTPTSCAAPPASPAPPSCWSITGDQASFPADIEAFRGALAADDLAVESAKGTHFGGPLTPEVPPGSELAAGTIEAWLSPRFPT